jgi:hypothetical protein
VKTTRGGRRRSTVTCAMSWPASGAVPLHIRLVRGTTVLATTRTTVRGGRATMRLQPARRLRAGRYGVLIAGADGKVVLRAAIRV